MTVIANTNERYITDDASSIYSLKKSVNQFMGDFAKLENQNKVNNGYFNTNIYGTNTPKYWFLSGVTVVYDKTLKSSSVSIDSDGFIKQEILGLQPNEYYTAIITCTCPTSGSLNFGVYGTQSDQIFNHNDDTELNKATQVINVNPYVYEKTIIQFKTNTTTVSVENYVQLTNISGQSINFTLEKIIVYKGLIEIDGISEIGAGISGNHNELDNLDGGTAGEYFHLTNTQYSKLDAITSGQEVQSIFHKIVLTGNITGGATAVVGNTIDLSTINTDLNFSFPILSGDTTDGRYLQVYRNGQRLTPGEEYVLIPTLADPTRCSSIFVNTGQTWYTDDTILFSIPSTVITADGGGIVVEVPIGTITYFTTPTAPQDYLVCDGSWKSRFTYSELYNVIGTSFGVSGDDFKLPDLRGEFIRGYDPTNIHDPDGSTRGFGSEQIDMFEEHSHEFDINYVSFTSNGVVLTGSGTTGTSGLTGGLETRPHNVNLLPCIKASSKTLGVKIAGVPMQIATYTASGSTTWNGSISIPTTSGNTTFKYMTSSTLKGRYLEIYLNGVRLELDRDYTEDGSTNVTATESTTVNFISLALENTDHVVFKTGNQGPPGTSSVGVPIGTILEFSSDSIPEGFLFCNGAELLIDSYPNLADLLGIKYGTASVSATHFKLPDTRGLFLRSRGGVNDPDGTRALGHIQQEAFKSHSHTSYGYQTYFEGGSIGYYAGNNANFNNSRTTSSTGGNETRPINMAINHIIKVL